MFVLRLNVVGALLIGMDGSGEFGVVLDVVLDLMGGLRELESMTNGSEISIFYLKNLNKYNFPSFSPKPKRYLF